MLKYRISDALECEWFSVKTLMNFLTTTKQSPKTKHQLGTSFWFWQTTTFLRTLRLWSKSQNHKTTKSKEIIKLNQIHVFLKQSLFTHTSLGKLSLAPAHICIEIIHFSKPLVMNINAKWGECYINATKPWAQCVLGRSQKNGMKASTPMASKCWAAMVVRAWSMRANGRYYIVTLKRWMNLWEIGALQAWPKVLIDELAQNFSKSEIGATLGDFRPKTAVINKAFMLSRWWEKVELHGVAACKTDNWQCQNSHEKNNNQLISDHVDSDLATVQFCMMWQGGDLYDWHLKKISSQFLNDPPKLTAALIRVVHTANLQSVLRCPPKSSCHGWWSTGLG